MRGLLICLLVVALSWTCYRLADVERQRYALLLGICRFVPENPRSLDCLRDVQPRASWAWDLFYGLGG